MEEGRQESPDPPNCTHQRHKITKHCFICFVRARGRPCVRADPCKVHRSEGSDFWKEVELHDLSLERRRKRKGATFSPSRKSMRVSSKPHRFQPLDFVTVNPSPAKGSKTTPKKRNKRSSGSDGEFSLFLCVLAAGFLPALFATSLQLFAELQGGRRGGTEILSVTVMLAAGYWLCRRLML